jgi:hypothetical protein
MLLHFYTIWYILRTFGIFFLLVGMFYGHLGNFSRFGKLQQEKSGNPAASNDSAYNFFEATRTYVHRLKKENPKNWPRSKRSLFSSKSVPFPL